MYVIAKPINGISINGDEFILDDAGKVQRFKNTKSARDFLRDHGIRKPEKHGIRILPEAEAAPELQGAVS